MLLGFLSDIIHHIQVQGDHFFFFFIHFWPFCSLLFKSHFSIEMGVFCVWFLMLQNLCKKKGVYSNPTHHDCQLCRLYIKVVITENKITWATTLCYQSAAGQWHLFFNFLLICFLITPFCLCHYSPRVSLVIFFFF